MRRLPAGAAVVAALVLAACASHQAPAPTRTVSLGGAAGAAAGARTSPALPPADEAFPGVRFGATRADVLRAYPAADCSTGQCLGNLSLFGMPASFVVFAQPDGRWVASLAIADSTAPARAFAQASAALRERVASPSEVEQGGNLLRWRFDTAGARQAVLRRCGADQKCRGAPHTGVELDYFAKGAPTTQPW